MNMTRDDVLRELELLPAWQLRMPASKVQNNSAEIAAEKPLETVQNIAPAETVKKLEPNYDYYLSDNNAWIFICPVARMDTGLQSMLFDNILTALQIKAKKMDINLADIHLQNQAKVIVAMGEKTAQSLLNSTENMDDLRSKKHVLHNLPLIVTYSTAEILEHLPNKAKTWHDLCTAISLVNA